MGCWARPDWAAAPETRPAQKPDRCERSRRLQSAAQSVGGSSKVFLRQAQWARNVFQQTTSSKRSTTSDRAFYDCWVPLTTRQIRQQRGTEPRYWPIITPDSSPLG